MHPLWNQIAGGTLTPEQLDQLDRYLHLLIEKNAVLNLTRITDRPAAELFHVADALTLLQHLPAADSFPPPLEGGGRGRGMSLARVAKKLPSDSTWPEKRLWSRLRNKQSTHQFRRQQPIGPYVVDFYCPATRLIVELDGRSHDFTATADEERQAWLEAQGYRVLRFENDDVLRDVDRVADFIAASCDEEPLLLPPPSREGGKGPRGTLADVGTGGGVPGVVLAIARPDLDVTLIDATRKKLDAVTEMASAVGLTNVRAHHGRAEAVTRTFDVVTARAVADLAKLVGWCRGLLRPTGVLLAMKGPKADEEIAAARPALRNAGLLASSHPVDVPALAGHTVVVVRRSQKYA